MLKIYNTLTQQKETFKPLIAGQVSLYVCGMTVYDLCHIGHARVLVAFDVIVRYLKNRGLSVKYIRNITDIDDKIIQRAQENHESITELTTRMIEAMHEDFAQLNLMPPTQEPKATESIAEIIQLIQILLDKGVAYQAENRDIFYAIDTFKTYGALAHQDLEKLRHGSRVAVELNKQDPLDFVLWKAAKPNEPSWESPWGPGRPGWHIECSAMSMAALGEQFDIHGGGLDLVFPHHQNEIAQSEAATDKKFVQTWIHVGFVQVNRQKMSKSLGNFFTLRDMLAEYPAEVVRYFLMASHYRSPIHYSQENLQLAQAALQRLYTTLFEVDNLGASGHPEINQDSLTTLLSSYEESFQAAMDDDFNTPEALAVLFVMTHEIHRIKATDPNKAILIAQVLKKQATVLGILQQNPKDFLKSGVQQIDSAKIESLIQAREKARAGKDWKTADAIRQELEQMGIALKDTPQGSDWYRL
ncbi:cysteine--tRNA ligase [Rickettsiella massiliensis]|uniref:cysteine--tRNA ligase n=1 Tax=Rickettsiella massiliensis TaxID=676517 RepID=UPI000299F8B2|nr:cysteine--tRNA ligase [Rickettsiella massiliensis]